MTSASPKGSSTMSVFPRTLSSIAVSVGGMALFLIFALWLSISHPIGSIQKEEATIGSVSSYVTEVVEIANPELNNSGNSSMNASPNSSFYPKMDVVPSVPPLASNATKIGSNDSGCDLYRGHWYYDSTGPLYTSNTCPIIRLLQNCQRNGRPDKEYENWRWKPSQCDLPRLDAKKFMELMRGKTLAFIGDSLARN